MTRTEAEIRRDLDTEEGRGSATRQSPTGRLVADVPGLLADVAAWKSGALIEARERDQFAAVLRSVAAALAGPEQAVFKVAAAQQVLIDAGFGSGEKGEQR